MQMIAEPQTGEIKSVSEIMQNLPMTIELKGQILFPQKEYFHTKKYVLDMEGAIGERKIE